MSYLREYIRIILLEQLKDSFQGKKMIFMAGAPGSGKSTVLNQLGLLEQFSIINPDDWYEPFLKEAGISLNLNCPLDGEYKVGNNWSETH